MAVRNLKTKPAYVYIPPAYTAEHKITVEKADGTVLDWTQLISKVVVNDIVTEGIGKFEIDIYDPDESLAHTIVGNEIFRYYKDYSAEATTLRFRGRFEKPSRRGLKLNIKGRREDAKLFDIKVTKSYTSTAVSSILIDLITSYASGFTSTNVSTTTETITVTWYEKPFWECVQELCKACGYECYADANLDFHFFLSGSVVNLDEGCVHDFNIKEEGIEDFHEDLTQIRNKIKVYGATVKGVQQVYTAETTTGQYGTTSFGERTDIINDESITSYDQAKEVADYTLQEKIVPPVVGAVTVIPLLATLKPGDKIFMSSPQDNIVPGYYIASGYEDVIDVEGGNISTKVFINKEPRKISHVLKARIEADSKKNDTSANPYGMNYAYTETFEQNVGTHVSTQITDGLLVLQSGASTGLWTGVNRSLASNLTEVYLIMNGQTLTSVNVSVSADDGATWTALTNRTKTVIINTGANLKPKVEINSANSQVESISILYDLA